MKNKTEKMNSKLFYKNKEIKRKSWNNSNLKKDQKMNKQQKLEQIKKRNWLIRKKPIKEENKNAYFLNKIRKMMQPHKLSKREKMRRQN